MRRATRQSGAAGRCEERSGTLTTGILGALFAVIYLVLLIWLGIRSLRRGHWVMFIVGIFIPLFWIIGAIIPARR